MNNFTYRINFPSRQSDVSPKGRSSNNNNFCDLHEHNYKNDPYYKKVFVSAGEELFEIVQELNHFTSLEGLRYMTDDVYSQMSVHSKSFEESVPKSTFDYYIAVMAWARVLFIQKKNNYRVTKAEKDFIEIVFNLGYVVPKSIGLLLEGIGNTTIPFGPKTKFKLKDYHYDVNGYFEQLDINTHLITGYPCLAIYSQRIREDLRVTNNAGENTDWNPNGINHVWNERCMGYHKAVHLTPRNRVVIDNAGITQQNFPSSNETLPLNILLLNFVNNYITKVPALKTVPIPTALNGSQGQFIINVYETMTTKCLSMTAKSPFKTYVSVDYLGAKFMFRINKNLTPSQAARIFPYTIAAPNATQIATLNGLQNGWSPIFNEIYHFEMPNHHVDIVVQEGI